MTFSFLPYREIDLKTKSGICTDTTILLTLLVVIGHVTRMYSGFGLFSSQVGTNGTLAYVTSLIYSFHMPAFMAVSGAVFSLCINDLGKYNDSKAFVINKLMRLIIPYFIFLLLFVNPVMLYVNKLDGDLHDVLLNNLLFQGDTRHLWFLPVLFGCFIVMYAFRKVIERYPLLTLAVTLLAWVASLKLPIPIPVVSAVLYYLVFFYTGYLILRNIERLGFIKSPRFLLPAFIIIVAFCSFTNHILVKFILNILGIFFSMGCGWCLSALITPGYISRSLSKNSFGIYLFHPLLIYIAFFSIIESGIKVSPIIFATLLIISVILCSILLTEGLRLLHLHRIIGEIPPPPHTAIKC